MVTTRSLPQSWVQLTGRSLSRYASQMVPTRFGPVQYFSPNTTCSELLTNIHSKVNDSLLEISGERFCHKNGGVHGCLWLYYNKGKNLLRCFSGLPYLYSYEACFLQAGPGTIAEAMIRGLPIILNDYIAGQVSISLSEYYWPLFASCVLKYNCHQSRTWFIFCLCLRCMSLITCSPICSSYHSNSNPSTKS